jgi:ATP-binding cassette subfamily C protein
LKKIPLQGDIKMKNVSYIYSGTTQTVLSGINIDIKPRQLVAFTGTSGCGKSTLLKLLLGFQSPNSGFVMYDDYPVSQLNLRALRKQFGVVLQNAKLTTGSIRDNIMSVNTHLSDDEIWKAAEVACIADEIRQMPMGLNTIISASDNIVSRGQAQRILIAKAVAGQPKILFFDEATSALDTITQSKIMRNIEQMEITRVLIAHRLSSIKHANIIFVIHEGRVVEQGDFDTLLTQQGVFYHLMNHG